MHFYTVQDFWLGVAKQMKTPWNTEGENEFEKNGLNVKMLQHLEMIGLQCTALKVNQISVI